MPLNSLHLDQIVGRSEIKYDLRQFAYIGSQEKTPTSGEMGRPMMAGPGVPQERIKALRDAYGRALRDQGLIEEAKKGQMDLEYTAGTELQAQIKEIISQPREVIELVKRVLTD